MAMNDSNYTPISQDFTSGNLIYSPKQWADNELIERIEMNNIEQGIQIALKQTDDIRTTSETAINNMTSYYTNTILPSLNSFNTRMDGLSDEIAGYVEADLNTNNSNIVTTLQQVIGVTDYNIQSLPYSRPNGVKAIDTRITELYNEVFGQGSSGSTSANSLNARLQALTTTVGNLPTDISAIIGPRLGPAYYSNNNWVANYTDVDTRITQLYDAIFGQSSSGSNKTILEQIQDLNTAIFGSSSGGTSSGSLIDKVEKAMGRSLDLEDGETADGETGAYSNSLTAQINQIKGTLGMDGGTAGGTSSLINDVDTLLNLMYGYTITTTTEENPEDPENPIITKTINRNLAPVLENLLITNGYATLYDDFYNITVTYQTEEEDPTDSTKTITVEHTTTGSAKQLLSSVYSQIIDVRTSNATLNQTISQYTNTIQRSERSYIAAEIETLGENEYLVLQRDPTAASAPDEASVAEGDYNNNTYILLPKGGGGGGATYDLQSSIVNIAYPTNSVVVIGESCPITFTWRITDDNDSPVGVNGNLTVRLDNAIVLSQTIRSNETQTIDLGQYITTSGNNQLFTIIITNAAAQTRRLYTTISAYNAILTSTFNANIIQTGSYIEYPYLASIGSASITKVLHIEIDGEEVALTGNETLTERQSSIIFDAPEAGDHLMKVWFTAITEGKTITSNILYYGILCGASLQTRIASNFVNGTEIRRYNNLIIQYLVVTPNREQTEVKFYINDNPTAASTLNVPPTYQEWSYSVTENAGPLKITIAANGVTKDLYATVLDDTQIDLSMVTSGLRLFLNANQRSNNEQNPNYWANAYEGVNAVNVTPILENFLFYGEVDGWQQESGGAYFLRLRNQNKITIPFSIFNNNITENGMTLEIDFKTRDVADYDTNIIECYEGNSLATSSKNIVLTAQNATLNNTKTLTTQYKEEEKITIDFVINPTSEYDQSNAAGLLYIYINGILSAATPYEGTALSFNNPSSAKMILGSSNCTLDLYSIKYYDRALDYKDVIKNWIYNTSDFNEKLRRYNRNNYSSLSIAEFTRCSPSTPYMVITGAGPLDGENAFMPQQKGSDYKKTVDIYYRDPVHPEYDFDANSYPQNDTITGVCEVQVQGTSSQAYYRKNYKIKFKSFTQNGMFHIKEPKDEHYNITYDEQTGAEISRTLKENITKEGYKLRENSYPEFTFCIKADVASSESVNNTGLVQIYDSAIRHFSVTPPQFDDPRIRQGVEGYPMVVWYRDSVNGGEILLGKYNFNNDKGTQKVYGLKSSLDLDKTIENRSFDIEDGIYDESWEVKNNGDGLVQFEVPGAPNSTMREDAWFATTTNDNGETVMKWQEAFESRFPDQDDEGIALITDRNSTYLRKRLAGLREMVEWVNDTVEWTDESKTAVTPESAALFKQNFENYFNLDAMKFFYLFTELFLMVDNRAKNMFWTRYQVRDGKRPKTTTYTNTDNNIVVNLVTTPNLAPDGNNYYGWFTYPYDFDTALGINNKGVNVYDYHWESLDVTGPDGSAIFGGQYSKLWVAFRQAYQTEIAAFYPQMINYVNYNIVENLFEQNQSIWSETIVNEDMIVKYINWKTADGYNMLLGLKDMQRKWWLYNRFKYFNSKFAIERGTDNINIRIHVNNANIPVQVYADSYVSVNVGANGTPTTVRVRRGETGIISVGSGESSGTDSSGIETYISPASALKSVQNLSTFMLSSIDVSKAIRLQSLQIGTANPANKNLLLRSVSVTPASGYTSLLRHIDLRNCENCSILTDANGNVTTTEPVLDVSGCLFLNRIYLAGTQLHGVTLPNGGVLETVQYPTSVKNITIINQPYLTNLIIGNSLPSDEITEADSNYVTVFNGNNDYSGIISLYLINSPYINTLSIVKEMSENGYLYLGDIDWTMTTTEFLTLAEKILNMHGFNGTQPSNDIAAYLSGTLHLTTLPTTQEIEYIGANFSNLKLYYQDINGEDHEYYTVRFYDPYQKIIDGKTQYVASGNSASFNKDEFFTEEYLLAYNQQRTVGWTWGAATRYNFKDWDTSFTNVNSDLEVHPIMELQYRMDYVLQTADVNVDETIQAYIFEGEEITPIQIPGFERNYYWYSEEGWTKDSNRIYDSVPEDTRTKITSQEIKAAEPESWYAIYKKEPQTYYVNIYTTDVNGNKAGEPLNTEPIRKNVLSGGSYGTTVVESEVSSYLPTENNNIAMYGSSEKGIDDEERTYRFLSIKPYIPTAGISVTGNMDILITYYHKDDIFTNYFLNKIYTCDLTGISAIPNYAFNHNTNLEKLTTEASNIGNYSFINFTRSLTDDEGKNKRRIFIFENTNVNFGTNCFQYLNNALIIFKGSGQITIDSNCFNQIINCRIVAYKTNNPIRVKSDVYSGFSSFTTAGTNNILYVTSEAKEKYPTSTNNNNNFVPNNLISSARTGIVSLEEATADYQALLEEAGINDY